MGLWGRQPLPVFGYLMREHRRNAGLTQHELAANSGLSVAAIRDLEQGRRSRPWPRSIEALTQALSLAPDDAQELEESARRARDSAHSAGPDDGPEVPLRIQVLGPLAVRIQGKVVPVGSHPQQAVLGLLAINYEMPVSQATIFELLWGEQGQLARNGSNIVQSRVSQLRRTLQIGAYDDGFQRMIVLDVGGYVLRVGVDDLDLAVFHRLVSQADAVRRTNGIEAACVLYERAFELYRGEPCANVSMLKNHPAVTKLRRELTDALLRYAEAASALGRRAQVIRHLEAFAATDRLNERIHAILMIALAGSGQQAQALRIYDDLRERLRHELGIDPSAELEAAHLSVLRQTVSGARGGWVALAETSANRAAPRQLPVAPHYLCGREEELADLTALLAEHSSGGAPTVVTVTGIGGIGKSALVAYWGREVSDRFPDGQLYADLRGFAPSGSPPSPAEVVRRFLTAMGMPDGEIPPDFDSQFTLFRSMTATKKVLVVLDNARNAEQVRPLLPGTPGSFVLVTSRNRLTGLAASPGACPLMLDCLTEEQSRMLLVHGLGDAPVANNPRAIRDIVALCAGHPLALCNTIAQAAGPWTSLSKMATALGDEPGPLDALETRDETTSLRAVFSWSQATLSDSAERMFRFLGAHPGPDITVAAAASLVGVPARDAYLSLADLAEISLVTEHGPGRYACHPLLRAYAAELFEARESSDERRAATHRLIDHYQHTAVAAWACLEPGRRPPLVSPALPGVVPLAFCSRAQAEAWLQADRHVLLAMIQLAAEDEFTPHAWELPSAASPFMEGQASWRSVVAALDRALVIAGKIGDKGGQLVAHQLLGLFRSRLGAHAPADPHRLEVTTLADQLQDEYSTALHRLQVDDEPRMALAEAEYALEAYRRKVHWHLTHRADSAKREGSWRFIPSASPEC